MMTTTMKLLATMSLLMMSVGVEAQNINGPTHGWDTTVCSQEQEKPGYNLPNLPQSFSLRVEANILDKKKTTTLHEYFNYDANVAAVRQVDNGGENYFFYYYDTNEYLTVAPDSAGGYFCFKQNLSTNVNRDMFGLKAVNSSMDRIFSVQGALHFGNGISELYQGKEYVRGIPCNKWLSCQYWKEMDATSQVYWYFSDDKQWSSISGFTAPVRCHVTGKRWVNGTSHTYDHIYEFYDFQADITAADHHFEVPDNAYCYAEKNRKPLPTLPTAYSFEAENLDMLAHTIGFVREEYDSKTQLLRYDYRDAPQANSPFGTRYVSQYHDFNTGVAYIIDVLRANCTVSVIGRNEFDDVNVNGGDVRFKNPNEFLDLNHNYVYQGVKHSRGIDCDTWAAMRYDYPTPGINNPPTTWTWYFATTDWMRSMGYQGNLVMPVKLEIFGDTPNAQIHKQMSFYEYNTEEPDLLQWDLSSCYTAAQSRNYAFLVPGRFRDLVSGDLKVFKYNMILSLQVAINISPLRIAKLDVQEAGENTLVMFDLLDKAPLKGDVVRIPNEPSLTTAYNNLNYKVQHGQMKVLVANPGFTNFAQKVVLPVGSQYQVQGSRQKRSAAPSPPSPSTRFSGGAMGGMAVGMLVLGALLGFGVMFLVYRLKGGTFSSDVPMNKFENETEGSSNPTS